MPPGTSWSQGAITALLHLLDTDPANADALSLVGALSFSEQDPEPLDRITAAMIRAVNAGVTLPVVLRACDEYSIRRNDITTARRCAERGLALGSDSTWHLLRLARLSFRDADTLHGAQEFYQGLAAAHDSLALDEAAWHVQWFVSPDELNAWDSLLIDERANWIHARLLARDVRDGQPSNARIAEHFGRLEYVLANFALELPDVIRRAGGITGSTPETGFPGKPDAILACMCQGDDVSAYPFRFYHRWQTDIDDRGMVWMRYGKPDVRAPAGSATNPREGWVYRIDGQTLVLDFEGEAFDGSVQATRLVEGTLGKYMCDYDSWRCMLSERAQVNDLKPEDLQHLKVADREEISRASTSDDNSPRGLAPIATAGHFYRLLDPRRSGVIALIVYRLRIRDLLTHAADSGQVEASFDVAIRQLNSTTNQISDTTFRRHAVLDKKEPTDAYLDGVVVVPSDPNATTWSAIATQDGRRGRVAQDGLAPLPSGPLELSDLILGAEGSGLHVTLDGATVLLPPPDGFRSHDAVHLYYQLRSAIAHGALRTTITFYHTDRGSRDIHPALQLRFNTSTHAGFNAVDQGVNLSQLGNGPYRMELTVTDERGETVTQSTAFTIR